MSALVRTLAGVRHRVHRQQLPQSELAATHSADETRRVVSLVDGSGTVGARLHITAAPVLVFGLRHADAVCSQ